MLHDFKFFQGFYWHCQYQRRSARSQSYLWHTDWLRLDNQSWKRVPNLLTIYGVSSYTTEWLSFKLHSGTGKMWYFCFLFNHLLNAASFFFKKLQNINVHQKVSQKPNYYSLKLIRCLMAKLTMNIWWRTSAGPLLSLWPASLTWSMWGSMLKKEESIPNSDQSLQQCDLLKDHLNHVMQL